MADNFTLLRSLHLLLSASFCLQVSFKQNINFVREFYVWNKVSPENFRHQISSSETVTMENFSQKLFEIEINANENKANYGIS